MLSDEPDLSEAHNRIQAQFAATKACTDLALTAVQHRLQWDSDALYIFLEVHQCICNAVAESKSTPIPVLHMNASLVQKCIDAYQAYQERTVSPSLLPKGWVWAFDEYRENRFAFSKVLPMMTTAHILEDVEAVLYGLDVKKKDFDVVFEDIIRCAEDVIDSQGVVKNFEDKLLRYSRKLLNIPRKIIIRELREIAWTTAQKRARLGRRR